MIAFILLCLLFSTTNIKVDALMMPISKEEDLELERQLKLINKSPVKSIQTKFGHIIDCIDIHKQLAFDHPLLKNHKLQLKSSFKDTATKANMHDRSARLTKIGFEKDLCPIGTVPIQRTTKDDLIRAKQLANFTSTGILTKDLPGQHFAGVHLKQFDGKPYYGVSGTISAYNPTVAQGQMSGAFIWLQNGPDAGFSNIFTGWQVFPLLYGDSRTHFFTSWSDDTRHTGCYNTRCSGFVQVDKRIYLGSPVDNTSTYGGTQFEMIVSFAQDPDTQNWWLRTQNIDVGYFPAALFSNMPSAEKGGWNGQTLTTPGYPSPPMGSGHLPNGNYLDTCYFRQMGYKNGSRQDVYPQGDTVDTFADNPSCFNVDYYGWQGEEMGYSLLFGGPGGNCGD